MKLEAKSEESFYGKGKFSIRFVFTLVSIGILGIDP
jgi:hypothetical protein